MKEIFLDRIKVDLKDYKKRSALITDANNFISDDVIIYDKEGNPQVLYMKLNVDTSNLRWAVKSQKYSVHTRTDGLKTSSSIFGYSPRNAIRNDFCTLTAMGETYPKQHYVITNFIKEIQGIYEQYFPNEYELHKKIVSEKVLDEWKIEGSPFTSGIVNKNNPLKYHLDSGNFKGLLSNMVVLKKGVKGGHLVIPEYDVILECADNTLVVFNGQNLVHGVSSIEHEDENAYRYTIVYYSLEQMWQCNTIGEEIKRIKVRKTEKEKNRINPEHIKKLENILEQQKINKTKELERVNELKAKLKNVRHNRV